MSTRSAKLLQLALSLGESEENFESVGTPSNFNQDVGSINNTDNFSSHLESDEIDGEHCVQPVLENCSETNNNELNPIATILIPDSELLQILETVESSETHFIHDVESVESVETLVETASCEKSTLLIDNNESYFDEQSVEETQASVFTDINIHNFSGQAQDVENDIRVSLDNNSLGESLVPGISNDSNRSFSGSLEDVENRDVNVVEEEAQSSDSEIRHVTKKRKISSTNRVKGEKYLGYKRREGKVFQDVPKNARVMKDRCQHLTVKKKTTNRTFKCSEISDKQRKKIFNHFWTVLKSWKEKKVYILGLVTTRNIRRRRKEVTGRHHKDTGHDNFLPSESGEKVRVCRTFFLNTLDLGRDSYLRWVKETPNNTVSDESEDDLQVNNANGTTPTKLSTTQLPNKALTDNITSNITTNKKKFASVKKWLQLLPKVPSHYCRASSNKTYVESTFRSQLHMYSVYKDWCIENSLTATGRSHFSKILTKEKIAIHHPRKDQCDTCCGFRVGSVDEDEYNNHIKRKDDARTAKQAAKNSISGSADKLVITMDLQSVLLCPKTQASAMYYKQKLQVHNFTIYELNNGDVVLYVWHEGNGGVSSNEFTSCIVHYISSLPAQFKHVVLISDGCNYQNRNKVLASALSNLAQQKSLLIEQLFLEKGHTMMEADNVHATLEQYFKPPINSPSDYIARMRLARPKQPYKIHVLDYNFFLKYDDLPTNLPSLRPGKKAGDPTVTDLRQLKYHPTGEISYQLGFSGEWTLLPQRRKTGNQKPKQLYMSQPKISESKYKHLQELKSVIEKDHHHFYDSLKFKPDKM